MVSAHRFGLLTPELARQLGTVPKTANLYYPCLATLNSGATLDFVYLAEAEQWFAEWGVWPDEDPGKRSIAIEKIARVQDSPSRLPAWAAEKLYEAGESGMGYTIFTLCFAGGAKQAYGTGNAIDFVSYPIGQSASTIVEVLPHEGKEQAPRKCPDYVWCLYSLQGLT